MNELPTGSWPSNGSAQGPFPHLPYTFGRYELLHELGGGGMGVVFEAQDTVLQRTVALKVPRAADQCSPDIRELFRREFQIGARLSGLQTLSICQIFDAGEIAHCPFFTMEFIRGQTLGTYWRQEGYQLGVRGLANIVYKLARVLQRVHGLTIKDETIVHRDLKPNNILITFVPGESEPRIVLLDFGLAMVIRPGETPVNREIQGTFGYMPPEQMEPGWRGTTITPRTDVYSLGAVLYQLITGVLPFKGDTFAALREAVLKGDFRPPSELNPLYKPFDDICLRAMARHPDDRFPNMHEFAEALSVVYLESQVTGLSSAVGKGPVMSLSERPAVARSSVRVVFVPFGFTAPPSLVGQNRLFLDVGNRLAEGVIDHHHLRGADGPTAKFVRDRTDLIDASFSPNRQPTDPFTIVLHQHPDLDAVASCALAMRYVSTQTFPEQADELIRYVERSDAGENCLSLARPFTLYSAFQRIAARTLADGITTPEERWRNTVRDGVALIEFVMAEAARQHVPLEEVDAFAAPGFTSADRDAVLADASRYRVKLADPLTRARRCRLQFKSRTSGVVRTEGLIVRNVQNSGDPNRCSYFKDWARSDDQLSRDGGGFAALSVFMPEELGHSRRCILSVTPGSNASLEGLGKLLDVAESERRVKVLGADDRKTDPATGAPLLPRPGYDNADPWYDGRGHDYTIVDSPRSGTLLTADEIEGIFLSFGHASAVETLTG